MHIPASVVCGQGVTKRKESTRYLDVQGRSGCVESVEYIYLIEGKHESEVLATFFSARCQREIRAFQCLFD